MEVQYTVLRQTVSRQMVYCADLDCLVGTGVEVFP